MLDEHVQIIYDGMVWNPPWSLKFGTWCFSGRNLSLKIGYGGTSSRELRLLWLNSEYFYVVKIVFYLSWVYDDWWDYLMSFEILLLFASSYKGSFFFFSFFFIQQIKIFYFLFFIFKKFTWMCFYNESFHFLF